LRPSAPHNTEEYLRWRLKRNRTVATGLLAVMAVFFTATHLIPEPGILLPVWQGLELSEDGVAV
jgi:hypothetical protein